MIFSEDLKALRLPQDIKADLQRQVDGEGCPVLLWGVHLVRPEDMEAAQGVGARHRSAVAGRKVTDQKFSRWIPGLHSGDGSRFSREPAMTPGPSRTP